MKLTDYATLLRLAAITILLNACTNSLVVEGKFPSPLTDTLPLTLGIYYDDDFRDYVYEEKSKGRSKWIIESGQAQIDLFTAVLPRIFNQVIPIDALPPQNPTTADLILSPAIDEFQYAIPSETKVKVFEVWIKFNLRVYDKSGQLVADWILPAYGKTPSAFLKSKEEAMNEAVVVALRDLGASLSLGFADVPEIKAWLEQQ